MKRTGTDRKSVPDAIPYPKARHRSERQRGSPPRSGQCLRQAPVLAGR